MKVINTYLEIILKGIMAISTFVVLSISIVQVLSRFIFQLPIPWSSDVIRMAFIYAVFAGAAYCAKKNEHINLDVLLSALSVKKRDVMELVIYIVVLIFSGLLTYHGFDYAMAGLNAKAPYLPISMSAYFIALPICTTLIAFFYFQHFIEKFRKIIFRKEG